MSITVMTCYARSGGTILNRCLGSLPNVVMMSEVNPLGGGSGSADGDLRTVKEQASKWYDIELKSEGFLDNVLELYEYCNKNNKHLILRDWPFINFYPFLLNDFKAPDRLLILEELKGKVDVKPFAFVRDSIDAWISLGAKKPKKYFPYYRKYAEEIVKEKIPFFKYEDFCIDPDITIKNICSYAGIAFDDSYKSYESFNKVNGDTYERNISRGVKGKSIKPLPRKRVTLRRLFQLKKNKDMIEANKLFGYETEYSSVELEEFDLRKALKRFFRNFRI